MYLKDDLQGDSNKILGLRSFRLLIVFTLIFLFVTVFDIPFFRQGIGFIYLIFLPGYLLLKLIGKADLEIVTTCILSVSLSIAFLMFSGLIIDIMLPALGLQKVLSFPPLVISLTTVIFGVSISVFSYRKKSVTIQIPQISPVVILYAVPPIISVIGVIYAKVFEVNTILLLTLPLIAVLIILSLKVRLISEKISYPLLIYSVSLVLLFSLSLYSKYVTGFDVWLEHYIASTVRNNSGWSPNFSFPSPLFSSYYQMLSVTILPNLFASILKIDVGWVFKILYPLIFSLVPVGVFQFSKKYINSKEALIAVFLVISQITFYTEMLGLCRQMIAELFLISILLILFKLELTKIQLRFLFMFLSFGLVVSHYALTYIFIFIMLAYCVISYFRKFSDSKRFIPLVIFLSSLAISWNVLISGSGSFINLTTALNTIFSDLNRFFDLYSRGETVAIGLGIAEIPSFLSRISRYIAYLTQATILVGLISLYFLKKTQNEISKDYKLLASIATFLLAMCIVLPSFAETINMTRFYHILLLFISPLFVLGLRFILKVIPKRRATPSIIVLAIIILIPYFLFQTSFIYEVTGDTNSVYSIPLSKYRLGAKLYTAYGYIAEEEVVGSIWLSKYSDIFVSNAPIIVDSSVYDTICSYGMVYGGNQILLSNTTFILSDQFLVLGKLAIVYDTVPLSWTNFVWNTSELKNNMPWELNKIYSNGAFEINYRRN